MLSYSSPPGYRRTKPVRRPKQSTPSRLCATTRATYERRLRQYREDIVEVRRLVATAEAEPEALRSAIGKSR